MCSLILSVLGNRGHLTPDGQQAVARLLAPACSDSTNRVAVTNDIGPPDARTTWVMSSVGSASNTAGYGLQVSIAARHLHARIVYAHSK